jgi:rhodanese-related sulfurtransferase
MASPVVSLNLEAHRKRPPRMHAAWPTRRAAVPPRRLQRWQQEATRTTYLFDVRTPEEFAPATCPAPAPPGGQLVQETDHVASVRGARLVLADDDGVRANMSASWLAQMGWEVYVLDGLQPTHFSDAVPGSPRCLPRPRPN